MAGLLLTNSVQRLWRALGESKSDAQAGSSDADLGLVSQILDALPDYIWICDAKLRETIYISLACERLLGVAREDLLGDCRKLLKRVHEEDRHRVIDARRHADKGEYEQTYRIVRPDGAVRWIEDRGFMLPGGNGGTGLLAGIAVDVTERKAYEDKLTELAYHDSLTQLPNRTLFYDRLAHGLAHARRNHCALAVLLVDVDHFKSVNDSAGHFAGDDLLKEIARRLAACVRQEDTVARLGGDEFGMVLSELTSGADARLVAEKILQSFEPPFQLREDQVAITASVGIAVYPTHSTEPESLMKNADAAMYAAKHSGRNKYRFHAGSSA